MSIDRQTEGHDEKASVSERVRRLKRAAIAIVVAPLSTALLFGGIGLIDAADELRLLIALGGALLFYVLAVAVSLTLLLPVHLALGRRRRPITVYALIGGMISVALFVAFSLFTGDFGPPREWVWVPLYGGASFAALMQRGYLRD